MFASDDTPEAFAPQPSALKESKLPRAWRRYGYVDAFNPLTGWYDPDVIGIDVGITMLMVENPRTNFVCNACMRNAEAQSAFAAVFG